MTQSNRRYASRKILARNLRRFRSERGLTQEALASAAKLHRTYVGSVEREERNISLDAIDALAAALGVTVSELLNESLGPQ